MTSSFLRATVAAALAIALALPLTAAAGAAGTTTVGTRSTALGRVLTDGHGRTLYLFRRDRGSRSACSGACAAAWPPLIASGSPHARGGARRSLLGTTRRRDGRRQVTYRGHPVYRFIGDSGPGQTHGEGLEEFGGLWYVVAPSGRAITRG